MREEYDLKKLKVKRLLREVANNIAHLPIVQRQSI